MMTYRYQDGVRICDDCGCAAPDLHDRHACFWRNLERGPIGAVASTLAGQFARWNPLERRIATAIWERVKVRERPRREKKLPIIGATNFEVYEAWSLRGDQVVYQKGQV